MTRGHQVLTGFCLFCTDNTKCEMMQHQWPFTFVSGITSVDSHCNCNSS